MNIEMKACEVMNDLSNLFDMAIEQETTLFVVSDEGGRLVAIDQDAAEDRNGRYMSCRNYLQAYYSKYRTLPSFEYAGDGVAYAL